MTASALYSWLFRIQTHGLIAKRQDHEPTVSHVFISHAAPDKLLRVKPLVHALAIEGVRLWLDRPGAGDSHLNFDEEFIHRHGIESLRSGVGYDIGIREALRACSAVLVCLSRSAIDPERRVLQQEMTTTSKLVSSEITLRQLAED